MHYTKKQRRQAKLTIDLTLDQGLIAQASYYSHGRLRVRLVNSDPSIQNKPALYEYSPQIIEYFQQFRNVGPWSNEHIANSPHTTYRRLDLYIDLRDIATLTSIDTTSLPEGVQQC